MKPFHLFLLGLSFILGGLGLPGPGQPVSPEIEPRPRAATPVVEVDPTAPSITWLTEPYSVFSGYGELSAEINSETSGLCSIEHSFDHGNTWHTQSLTLAGLQDLQPFHQSTWSAHRDFREFSKGRHQIQLRVQDCAGNLSPVTSLVFQVE